MRLSTLRPLSNNLVFKYGARSVGLKSSSAVINILNLNSSTNPSFGGYNSRNMSSTGGGIPPTTTSLSATELGIESMSDIQTAPGVELDTNQKVLVGSVLDLFAGKPTLKKLGLWSDNATFADPLTNATGRKQYSAQWYGLAAVFSSITRISHSVTSSTNPITMSLKTNYKLKGVGKETVIESVVEIWVGEGGAQGGEGEKGKIVKVLDKWNGSIPEGAFAKAFRNLNAVTVPVLVSVPKSEEEELKK